MPRFRTLDDLDVAGKRVLLRADLNVPIKDGKVTDATRIERLAPTIEALIRKGAKVVVMSHFGRPKGPDPSQSLRLLVAPFANPRHPVMALIGGAKVSTKLELLSFMTRKVDRMAIGGAMANTFLFAKGRPVGRSLCEADLADYARIILSNAEEDGCDIILPEDAVT